MSTYKYGGWEDHWGTEYYAIHKKNFWGNWTEVVWYKYTEKGKERMMDAVEQLKKQGHLVL